MRSGNPYVIFVSKAALFLVLMFATDRVAGLVLQRYFLKMNAGTAAATTYALDKANEDLIVFGSSRALHHYVPSILRDSLGMTAYNAGRDGMTMLYSYAVFKSMLKRYTPRAVVLDVYMDFDSYREVNDRMSALSPHYDRHPEIRPIVNLRGPYERIKAFSKLYDYNSLLFTIVANNLVHRTDPNKDGYTPLNSNTPPAWSDFGFPDNKVDSMKTRYFEEFLAETRKANVEVFVVVSPFYGRWKIPLEGLQWAKRYCNENGFFFRDYSQSPYYLSHREWFSDNSHLNDTGARIFTRMLCSDIKEDLAQRYIVSQQATIPGSNAKHTD